MMFDESEILSKDEVKKVINCLSQEHNKDQVMNRILFRLSCCCGLRRKEIAGLRLSSIRLRGSFPHIHVDKTITKGQQHKRRIRKVPLWWDAGTKAEVEDWYKYRVDWGAKSSDPFLCTQRSTHYGKPLTVNNTARRWRTAIKYLDPDRVIDLSIHTGRHTFCSHSLAAGRSLIEVSRAAGHSSINTTQIYLHFVNRENVPDVFAV